MILKAGELRKKTPEELFKLVDEKRARARTLRFNVVTSKNKNVKELGTLRKEIAKILTVLGEKKNNG